MGEPKDLIFTALNRICGFCRIEPEIAIQGHNLEDEIAGKFISLDPERSRFFGPQISEILSITTEDLLVDIKDESLGFECIMFAIIFAVLQHDAYLKSIIVVHKDMEALMKAAEEDTELFGKFEFGHLNFKEINLQHAQNEILQGFQIRLAGIKDPEQALLELINIFEKQVPPLEFETNKEGISSTGIITIPIDTEHQIALYLEKAT